MKTDLFQSCGHCWVFQICWHIECSAFTASYSSAGIPSSPLALFIVMLPDAHLTLHSRMSVSRWVITPSWLSRSWRSLILRRLREYKQSCTNKLHNKWNGLIPRNTNNQNWLNRKQNMSRLTSTETETIIKPPTQKNSGGTWLEGWILPCEVLYQTSSHFCKHWQGGNTYCFLEAAPYVASLFSL